MVCRHYTLVSAVTYISEDEGVHVGMYMCVCIHAYMGTYLCMYLQLMGAVQRGWLHRVDFLILQKEVAFIFWAI